MALAIKEIDMELIAQRILKLAEIAMLEHLQGLSESQAQGLLEDAQQCDTEAA